MAGKIDAIDVVHAANSTVSGAAIVLKILVLDGGSIFMGNFGSWAGFGSNIYNSTAPEISTTAAGQTFFIADGSTTSLLKQVNAVTGVVTNHTTGGTGQPPTGARGCALYRNRLVLYRTKTDSNNWFMSKMDDYSNFDYSDETATGAVAGNNSDAGKIGDEITAFIPFGDDYALFGCQDSVWMLRGDPHSGGRIDNLIRGGGVVGQFAWARDSDGNIYYLSRTDLMRVPLGGGVPQSISQGRILKFLGDIDFSVDTCRMAWDAQNSGLWICFHTATGGATHLYWDETLDAFTTHRFPSLHGPSALRSLAGDAYEDRQILLGGFDGFMRTFSPNWVTDDGTAITSYMNFPPVPLGPELDRGILTESELVLGTFTTPRLAAEWYVADTPQAAIQAAVTATAPTAAGTLTTTGRTMFRARARGQVGVLRLSNSAIARNWAVETAAGMAYPAGRVK